MTIISERLQHLRLTHGYADRPCPNYGCDPPGSLRMGARQMPRDPHLIQLAQFYQVSTDYLLGLTE